MDVDVIVLGLGPGGEDAAGRLAEAGLRVAGVEANLVGGECPYWGCIPSKMMVTAANEVAEGGLAPDWAPVARRIREEATDFWNDKVAADRFTAKGGLLVRGTDASRGRTRSPWASRSSGRGGVS
ncbi:FAD-dependent oxidoreductase [Nonomuraea sp. NPDC059194]|uniref:FAD-dependent oxidoreductase n=1 Tax=Nonomuraea sp. NPDC059194 TaxID=3346764 RepID=UPI0036CF8E60